MQYGDDFSGAVRQRLEYEVGSPWHKRKEHPTAKQINSLIAQGYSIPQIGKAFKVSRTTIFRRLKAHELQQEELRKQEEERIRREEELRKAQMEGHQRLLQKGIDRRGRTRTLLVK